MREGSQPDPVTRGRFGRRTWIHGVLAGVVGATIAFGAVNDGHFATSPVCAMCHANAPRAQAMRDEQDRDLAPYDLWQATAMANSARDPFWRAMVRAEVAATPSLGEEIRHECTTCHAPMASLRPDLFGGHAFVIDDLPDASSDRARFGLDGVACAACHQIDPGALGTEPSYSGNVSLLADGRMFGPHEQPFAMPMRMHTGFTPMQGAHMDESALCGSCHTLRTVAVGPDGTPTGGHFLEQSPYLEWRNSSYTTEIPDPGPEAASCQACHMPSLSAEGERISTRIARRPRGDDFPPLRDRAPYHRHTLAGGNTLLPAILRDFADELRPRADGADFDAAIAQSQALLRHSTATLAVGTVTRTGAEARVPITIRSEVGHKFPAGYPSRRAWLKIDIHNARGETVFASGGVDDQGRIVGADGQPLGFERTGAPVEPHRRILDHPDQVQIYELAMGGDGESPVYRLLRASRRLKDNRLLPAGWTEAGPHAEETMPVLPEPDADFAAGQDTVEVRFGAPADTAPYTLRVQLLYQTLGARFAAELFALDGPEIRAFERMWIAARPPPSVVDEITLELGGL